MNTHVSDAGRWEVVFKTKDETEFRTHLHRVRTEYESPDDSMLRVDTLCGRLKHSTTYRLSLFVPEVSPTSTQLRTGQ